MQTHLINVKRYKPFHVSPHLILSAIPQYNTIRTYFIKNPNSPEAEVHDPDKLLKQYEQLLEDIEETQKQLKNELGAALAHHFEREDA